MTTEPSNKTVADSLSSRMDSGGGQPAPDLKSGIDEIEAFLTSIGVKLEDVKSNIELSQNAESADDDECDECYDCCDCDSDDDDEVDEEDEAYGAATFGYIPKF